MKYSREIKIGLLAVVCIFLLYFGMYFLRGVNIFSPTRYYVGKYEHVDGLTEQAPVYIRGYNVGQVEHIAYDFTRKDAFTIQIAIDKHIYVPEGSEMVLVADGLLGGKAIELVIPVGEGEPLGNDTLPTRIEPGLVESLQQGLLAHVDSVIGHIDSLVTSVEGQLGGDRIEHVLANVDRITSDLTVTSNDLKQLTHKRVPKIVDSVEVTIDNANAILANVRQADIAGTVNQLDSTINLIQQAMQSEESTLGLLLNSPTLYNHLDSTVVSADSLLIDIKANPKKYVHFSLW